jgi:RNA polymerase sigma factor (sigma-70 family)
VSRTATKPSPDELSIFAEILRDVTRRHRLSPEDSEDFFQSAHLRLIERNYDVFEPSTGKTSLRAHLNVVVTRMLIDWRSRSSGSRSSRAIPDHSSSDQSTRDAGFEGRTAGGSVAWDSLADKLRRYFEAKRCPSSQDLACETLSRCWVKLNDHPEVRMRNVEAFSFGIAKNVYHESIRAQRRSEKLMPLADDDRFWDQTDAFDAEVRLQAQELRLLLRSALARLPSQERRLIWRYYHEDGGAVCDELKLTTNALRVRVHRIASKVRAHVMDRQGREAARPSLATR